MKKTVVAILALAFGLSAGTALACDDPNCPHGGGKPPKKVEISI